MLRSSFLSFQFWIAFWAFINLQIVIGDHHEEEHDDMGFMARSDFDDLHLCQEPPPPMNGEMLCHKHKKNADKYVCKVQCDSGYQFPKGKVKARHICDIKSGKWTPEFSFPDCITMCTPPCLNGGECSEDNHCICKPDHRGDRCQYSYSLCDPNEGLHVNANWFCNHTVSDTICVLNCPQGTRYESQPAELYQCRIDGTWEPSFAPKCIPINIIESPASQSFHAISAGEEVNRHSSGVCAAWSASHYRTFDGRIYSSQTPCTYLFVKDCEQNTFSIHVRNEEFCRSVSSCKTTIVIYIGLEEFVLSNSDSGVSVQNEGKTFPVPVAVNGLIFQMLSDYVTVSSSLGFRLKWDRKNTILVKATNQLKNKTCGLCGKFDGSALSDFETPDGSATDNVEVFINSWAMEHLGEQCEGNAVIKDSCSESMEKSLKAEHSCKIIYDNKYEKCHQIINPKSYYEACKMDHCSCSSSEGSCHCNSLAEYFRECNRLGGEINGGWRNEDTCPLSCPNGMIYKDCGTSCPQTCKGTVYDCEDDHCIDGCHCPDGTVLHNGFCVEKKYCPCLHNEVEYQSGERVLQDCNACECTAGKWECTKEECAARCSSTGDPYYTTFDGLSYEYLGSCLYYLVYNENFTIMQGTGPCSKLSNSKLTEEAMFCTSAIKIEIGKDTLLLEPGIKVTFNEKVAELPLSENGFIVDMATNIFLKVNLVNGVSVLWDGSNRIYIDVPPTLYDQTMGLCGTFNHNQNDDFLTPDNDIEADVGVFAAKWQASDSCQTRRRRSSQRSACQMQPQKLSDAEMLCSVLKSDVFAACHGEIEPYPFYKACVNDLCLCGIELERCLCPILADYSMACTRKNIVIDWVDKVLSCKPECPVGQIYKECGNPCTFTCSASASSADCKSQCVQGCTCPDGMALNDNAICIPTDQCPCYFEGKEYPSSSTIVQGSEICSCSNANWQCRPESNGELMISKPDEQNSEDHLKCRDEDNKEFTDCLEECAVTCQNARLPPKCKTGNCHPGCRCKEGFILDTDLQKCVDLKECGCVHAAQRYADGDTIKQACNLCTCKAGKWQCTEKVCSGICTAWGESHFKTYDGKIFDFQGDCEYILSKGKMKGASYTLIIQNVPCGTSGITCGKSFSLDLGPIQSERGDMSILEKEEKLTLTRDDVLPKTSLKSRFVVLESGLFVLVYTDVGVTLRWDRGTRIYVTLDPKWRNRVKGLCGNFNGDQADDFFTPYGGLPEARSSVFADSWKVQEYCPQPQAIGDICAIHPQRKSWAQQKCGILKSGVFESCRAALNVEPFYERCVLDSCACDMGGDCDCLCTAIAAYAQECSIHGVPVKWRSQELCPIQCEECSTYDSCIPSCPKKTCENEYRYSNILTSCSADFCVEGCNPKPCPDSQIYNNEKEYKCIPKADCVIPCLEINDVIYNEGDRITDIEVADPCQSCHCHRGSVNCTGSPCIKEEPFKPCIQSGWTKWMNTPASVGGDTEEPSEEFCGVSNMTNIECRAAKSKIPANENDQKLICELPIGLSCQDNEQQDRICDDYEIRVFCDCGPIETFETTTASVTTPPPKLPPICVETGWTAWMSAHLPDANGETETLDSLRVNHYFCADHEIENIECRNVVSLEYAPKTDDDIICNPKLGYLCKGSQCLDHEVRVYCKCGGEVPIVPSCVTGWTEYFNTDHPDHSEMGDDESIDRIRENHPFCHGGTLKDIECKATVNDNLVDYSSLDPFGLKCSKNEGFICIKHMRTDKCPDLMVRFYCECEPIPETTTLLLTTPTSIPIEPLPVECGWTPWLNIDTPESGELDTGDVEDLAKIQFLYKTCGGKDLVDIECRMSRTHHSYKESLQKNLHCDTQVGFRCTNEDQVGNCYDYEIRLLCMYEWCYPPTTTFIPTTEPVITTPNPCPDGQVYDSCAYNCNQMCSSFAHEMTSKCMEAENGCIAGCRPDISCQPPGLWRDYYNCVQKEECMCIKLDDLTIVAPNDVIYRGCEKCQCLHDDLNCFTLPDCGTIITPAPPKIYVPEEILKEDCWTKWMNIDKPSSGGGDLEVLSEIRKLYQFCYDPVKIECRTASSKQHPYDVGQIAACDIDTGLVCWNTDNKPEDCYDYEIRFFCPCQTTVVPTTTSIPTPVPTLAPGRCIHGWTIWFNSHTPSERGEYESVQSARVNNVFCANEMITAIQCHRADNSNEVPLQSGVICDLEPGLVCNQGLIENGDVCWDYEVRFFCDCPAEAPVTTTTQLPITYEPTLQPGLCIHGWTKFFNNHTPNEKGEYENIQRARVKNVFCAREMITEVQCHRVNYMNKGMLQRGVVCDLEHGLVCNQDMLEDDDLCWDYEIRFFCDCPTEAPVTEIETSPPTTVPQKLACVHWSDWINEHQPNVTKVKGVKGGSRIIKGDFEKWMPLKLQRERNFCVEGEITDIQCREAETDIDYTESDGNKLACSLAGGFRCRANDQPNRICKDYKIRYFCRCKEIPTTLVITTPTAPSIYVKPCTVYYNIIDGPEPLPDSSLKASSSKTPESGPQSARLNSANEAGAWVAGEVNEKQFIEVDLGSLQSVYGVVTKGRNGYDQWVESYKVLYSRTGRTYAYVSDEDGSDKIFKGNFDNDTPVEHVFRIPFEARYVRIQPIAFRKEIALRMDVLGCAEGKITVPVITTTVPPCLDEMGLNNGIIRDYQIKTTSDRNINSNGSYVRLNTLQTKSHEGGWVAEHLNKHQFVQIDFVEPRLLTGVKIQGRDMVPHWVTAFTVSYSQNGLKWHNISDTNGIKIFPGNYDSQTISTEYFPQAIRARFIRIHPVAWENWIAMRLEILGCFEPITHQVLDEIPTTKPPVLLGKCHSSMGFENHLLPDTLISVSSSASPSSGASRIRLNTHADDHGTGGWIADPYDYKPMVFIDFYGERNLTGIITQGLEDADKWIMSYYVLYSLNNLTWHSAHDLDTGSKVFPGNFDRNTPMTRLFRSTIQARYLKLILVDYHILPALRMDVLGCFIPYPEITPPPPVLITTTEFCAEYGPWLSLSDPASNQYGDIEPMDQIISASGMCRNPYEIQCRTMVTGKDYSKTGQSVTCNLEQGLQCLNHEQSSLACYNYEVRIKCWTCGIETTTSSQPVMICPEVPKLVKDGCPASCPFDYSCDGQTCVPYMDCPCYQDGKRFQPPNIFVTKDCQKCECIVGGYSSCRPIQCPACLPGQKPEIDDYCTCNCVGCAEGTVLCPTSGDCVNVDQWCDGVRDCTDDETDCPTTTQQTTTLAPSTRKMPIICSTDNLQDTDTCEMVANMFETFDGLSYQYDICDHVLMKEKNSNLYSVTVHKSCSPNYASSCQRYLIIELDGIILKIGPSTRDVTVQENQVSSENFWFVSQRFKDFELRTKGNTLVFRSSKYHFDVVWDSIQDAKIYISKCSSDQVVGLCGFYNQYKDDDRTTPDGNLATSSEEFGNSWSIGSPEKCEPSTCPEYLLKIAIDNCRRLQEEPFNSSCTDHLSVESRIESCIVFMCECLQRNTGGSSAVQTKSGSDVFYNLFDSSTCKCQAYESFVDACEAIKQTPVLDWRIQNDCTPECPEGMEWQDCGIGCELTCDNYHDRDLLCNSGCTPGCYCPSGLIRHKNRCVKPKMCQDCICRGHGDPNYITFDGRYYAFQGNCTYVLAQHLSSSDTSINFRVLGTNVECPEEPHTSCTAGLQVFWNGHVIEKFKNKPVYLDGKPLDKNDSPLNKDGISITFVPNKSTIIHVKSINLAVRYFDQMYGFNIELPAFYYFNKTEGLCGVCNFIESDDLYHKEGYVTEDIENFAYSWLEEPERKENCQIPRVLVPEPPPEICNFTISPCEVFLDPTLYSKSCQNDITYSHKPMASMCRSKFQYAQQCCERGISLVEWLHSSGCESSCTEGMHFECTSACPKTCDNYKNYKPEECDLMPLYTCNCPKGQVLKLGTCVDEITCETCDALGHIVGDVWNVGPCEQCECTPDLSTRCIVTECPDPPICREKETLEKMQRSVNACCEVYQCKIPDIICPEAELQSCPVGEANVIVHLGDCPKYRCECMPELCPPLVEPLLNEGEMYSLEQEGCCPQFRTSCHEEKCSLPPVCSIGFKLSTYEGKCCLMYSCVPKDNVCVYKFMYDVINGSQVELPPEEYYDVEYEAGSSWQDGLCRKCSCIEKEGQFTSSCIEQVCKDTIFPDSEKYVYETMHTPGDCCPKYYRVSCKINEIIYPVDSEWASPDGDPCKSYRCIMQKGQAAILEKSTLCDTTCHNNAVYVEPSPESNKCCGECKAIACEENGILYQDGVTWISTSKPCFKAECSVTENGTHIMYRGESCPSMPDNCPVENIKSDSRGCCTYCKKQTESCTVVQVPIYETRGFFSYIDNNRGQCRNEEVVEDLTKCSGQCTTDSLYSDLFGDFQSICNCCIPLIFTEREIMLDCEDGSKVGKVYKQPSSCKCNSCSGIDRSLESMNQMEPL